MHTRRCMVLCLLVVTLLSGNALALAPEATPWIFEPEVDPEGYLNFTLPEGAIQAGETVDSYVIAWEPVQDVLAYHIGVYRLGLVYPGEKVPMPVTGWLGGNYVLDGKGEEYFVPFAAHDALEIAGDAAEADIAELVNALGADPDEDSGIVTLGYYCLVMVVLEDGAPVTQLIELP